VFNRSSSSTSISSSLVASALAMLSKVNLCNTSGVTMARAHLCTNDYDHMWKKLKEQKCKGFGS
jgi:hypothetical protein